ncbi:MAG TPA: cyanate transporter [Candidatus Paenalcaligenes intestinipullorum]|uniref:Cyanate transporter n=1 Tax=Candidatus Paenalcaligenes intestinipullorum TaxID=2838718 RepID=A0A9D2U9J6_9BURK|nr:cyanate transporter [Candidatus Paenalcaligenes intestinipullorum]
MTASTVTSTPQRLGLWLALVVLIGLNLRPFITATGPVVGEIASSTGLSFQGLAWLTLLPMFLMGVFAFLLPSLRRIASTRTAMLGALLILGLGCVLRLWVPNGLTLILTAGLCGIGVAVLQALLPGIIKQQFPAHVAPVTGLYSAMLMGGGALGAQLTPMVSEVANWQWGLAMWALPIPFALLCAWWILPKDRPNPQSSLPAGLLMRRPRTWLLIFSFGLINSGYATIVAWLSPYYQELGWSAASSGSLIAVLSIAQAASALSLPTLAARNLDRRKWLWLALSCQALGFASFAFWPTSAPYFWSAIMGIGLGGCFALTLVVALDHFTNPAQAGTLSALMQGGGFIITAAGPWVSASLRELSGSFVYAWSVHLCLVLVVAGLVWRFIPAHYERVMATQTLAS